MIWPLKQSSPRHKQDLCLDSPRLFLRAAVTKDYQEWASVRGSNYSHLKSFEPAWPDNALEEDFFERRIDKLNQDWRLDKGYSFLIFERAQNALIGGININNIARGAAQYASLGYWLSKDAQGHGYMNEAARTVLTYAFDELHLARMNAATLIHNEKSRSMLRRIGFSEEGFAKDYIQIDGKRQDHVLYGLNAKDFLRPSRDA